jgi:hypothetical protein
MCAFHVNLLLRRPNASVKRERALSCVCGINPALFSQAMQIVRADAAAKPLDSPEQVGNKT